MCSNGVQLRVRGKVQGVGFRPFVWQLAQALQLTGDVCNDGEGVLVRLAGNGGAFTARLHQDCPPLARIDAVDSQPFTWATVPQAFTIRHSAGGAMDTQIVPDAATCPACLAEMRDPRARRYRYPFINCTHCGPRFTIIRAMPYKEGGQFQTAGTISKEIDGAVKEYKFVRADRFSTLEEAADLSLSKGRQIVDEQGERMFK